MNSEHDLLLRPRRQGLRELTGPVYRTLNATRAQLAPSLGPEWNFTLADTTSSMETFHNHERCWSILSHRSGGPTHVPEMDIMITTEKENLGLGRLNRSPGSISSLLSLFPTRYDYASVFAFKDLRSSGARDSGSEKAFGSFRCWYKDNRMIDLVSLDDGIFSGRHGGMFMKAAAFIVSYLGCHPVKGSRFVQDSNGRTHQIYADDSDATEPVATLYLNSTSFWQLDLHDSRYYVDRDLFRTMILRAFAFACRLS